MTEKGLSAQLSQSDRNSVNLTGKIVLFCHLSIIRHETSPETAEPVNRSVVTPSAPMRSSAQLSRQSGR